MRLTPDRVLVARALEGDRDAAGRLFRRHQAAAWKAAHRACGDPGLADEALQEGFIRAVRHLSSYDPGRPFSSWVKVIVANRARTLAAWRAARGEVALEATWPAELDGLEQIEGRILATDALKALPTDQRDALVLCGLIGLTSDEAAELRGVTAGTIRSRIARARHQLRRQLDPSGARD